MNIYYIIHKYGIKGIIYNLICMFQAIEINTNEIY